MKTVDDEKMNLDQLYKNIWSYIHSFFEPECKDKSWLIEASDILSYHIWMLESTTKLIENNPRRSKELIKEGFQNIMSTYPLTNAVIESHAIRCRAFIDFFYGKANKNFPDDILVFHYFKKAEWNEILRTENYEERGYKKLEKKLGKRVGGQVAHISYKSKNNIEAKWKIDDAYKILKLCEIFVKHVSDDKIGSDLKDYKKRLDKKT